LGTEKRGGTLEKAATTKKPGKREKKSGRWGGKSLLLALLQECLQKRPRCKVWESSAPPPRWARGVTYATKTIDREKKSDTKNTRIPAPVSRPDKKIRKKSHEGTGRSEQGEISPDLCELKGPIRELTRNPQD